MNILFDHQAFQMQKYGGVSRSFVELALHMNQLGASTVISVKESDNVHLRDSGLVPRLMPANYRFNKIFGDHQSFRGEYRIKESLLKLINYQVYPNESNSIRTLQQQQFDIFEPTFFGSYFLPYLGNKPFVLTIHDLIPEKYPQYFSRDDFQIRQREILCPVASHIHVPSMCTKEDLINYYNIQPEKITVIPHGAPDVAVRTENEKPLFDFPYILYVGERGLYKNFKLFLREFSKIIKILPDVKLVATGRDFSDDEKEMITSLELSDNIIHYFATKDTFGRLYGNAISFVYPSDYEGFGIPILESFAYGCPVMLNEASCFPEVAGDAAIFFSINEKDSDFYDKFIFLYEMSTEDRVELINKGYKRLSQYSWEKSAKQLLDVYNTLS